MPFIHRGRGIGMTPMLEGVRVAGTVEFSGVDGVPNEKRADQGHFPRAEGARRSRSGRVSVPPHRIRYPSWDRCQNIVAFGCASDKEPTA